MKTLTTRRTLNLIAVALVTFAASSAFAQCNRINRMGGGSCYTNSNCSSSYSTPTYYASSITATPPCSQPPVYTPPAVSIPSMPSIPQFPVCPPSFGKPQGQSAPPTFQSSPPTGQYSPPSDWSKQYGKQRGPGQQQQSAFTGFGGY